MQLRKNIALSESGFIFNPSTGDSFSVNPLGLSIMESLKEGKAESAILEELSQAYEVSDEQLKEDYMDFLNHLKQLNLISDGNT